MRARTDRPGGILKVTGRKGWMLYVPVIMMFCVTLTALVQAIYGIYLKIANGGFVFMVDGLQLILHPFC